MLTCGELLVAWDVTRPTSTSLGATLRFAGDCLSAEVRFLRMIWTTRSGCTTHACNQLRNTAQDYTAFSHVLSSTRNTALQIAARDRDSQ